MSVISLSLIIIIDHHAHQPSFPSAIMPLSYHAYQPLSIKPKVWVFDIFEITLFCVIFLIYFTLIIEV